MRINRDVVTEVVQDRLCAKTIAAFLSQLTSQRARWPVIRILFADTNITNAYGRMLE